MGYEIDHATVKELLDGLIRPLNGTCEFVLSNGTPADWGVVVTQGGAKFFYSDGTDFTDGPKPLNLSAGDAYSFYSNDPSKCVKQIFLAINVSVPGEQEQTMTYTSEMADDEKCWMTNGVTIGPANFVPANRLGRRINLTVRRTR